MEQKLTNTNEIKKTFPYYYNITVQWSSDRKGIMCSPELNSIPQGTGCIEVATPPEFPEGIPGIWSPEHLFTASVSSCLMTTFLAIAANSRLEFSSFRCGAKGKLDKGERGFQMTEITLYPEVVIADQKHYEKCERILQKSEKACLITNSIASKVEMEYVIKVEI